MNAREKFPQPFADHVASRKPGDTRKVFPVRPGGKEPACLHGHLDATADPERLRKWAKENPAYNVGHCPEDNDHFVLDIDPQNGGHQSLAALEAKYGSLPTTRTIRTPRGGKHLWFGGSAPSSAGKLGAGLDIRGSGGYVLLPSSVTEHGEYILELDIPAVEAPAWLTELASTPKHEPRTAPDGFEFDQPWNVTRAKQHAKTCQPAIEGQGGDNRTLQVAYDLRDLGCSEETTLAVMQDHFNPRCEPEWDSDELAIKVANAFRYAQNEAGCHSLEDPAKFLAHCSAHLRLTEDTTADIRPIPFRDVLKRTVAPVQELIPGLIEKGTVTFLSAPGGSHKSRVALQFGLSIDAGVPIFGRPVEPAAFHYLSYEDPSDEVARRSQLIAQCLFLPPDSAGQYWDLYGANAPLATVHEDGTVNEEVFCKQIREHLRSIPCHKFVVIDSCYNALRFAGRAKINETSVMVAIGFLQRLCNETDSTILVLWHPSVAGQERGDASGWSVAWHNGPRARLSLTPVKESEDTFELKVEKRNHGAKGKSITLHWSSGVLLPRSETNAAEQGERLSEACIQVALASAESGQPIQKQRRLNTWMLDDIERAAGYRPRDREVKEVLARALRAGRLRYLLGSKNRTAGYYPSDQEQAEQLARDAKRGREGGADA